jgi:hypothetical protein
MATDNPDRTRPVHSMALGVVGAAEAGGEDTVETSAGVDLGGLPGMERDFWRG